MPGALSIDWQADIDGCMIIDSAAHAVPLCVVPMLVTVEVLITHICKRVSLRTSPGHKTSTITQAIPYRDRIPAVGLSGAERGNPNIAYKDVYAAAIDAGFIPVAHAGAR